MLKSPRTPNGIRSSQITASSQLHKSKVSNDDDRQLRQRIPDNFNKVQDNFKSPTAIGKNGNQRNMQNRSSVMVNDSEIKDSRYSGSRNQSGKGSLIISDYEQERPYISEKVQRSKKENENFVYGRKSSHEASENRQKTPTNKNKSSIDQQNRPFQKLDIRPRSGLTPTNKDRNKELEKLTPRAQKNDRSFHTPIRNESQLNKSEVYSIPTNTPSPRREENFNDLEDVLDVGDAGDRREEDMISQYLENIQGNKSKSFIVDEREVLEKLIEKEKKIKYKQELDNQMQQLKSERKAKNKQDDQSDEFSLNKVQKEADERKKQSRNEQQAYLKELEKQIQEKEEKKKREKQLKEEEEMREEKLAQLKVQQALEKFGQTQSEAENQEYEHFEKNLSKLNIDPNLDSPRSQYPPSSSRLGDLSPRRSNLLQISQNNSRVSAPGHLNQSEIRMSMVNGSQLNDLSPSSIKKSGFFEAQGMSPTKVMPMTSHSQALPDFAWSKYPIDSIEYRSHVIQMMEERLKLEKMAFQDLMVRQYAPVFGQNSGVIIQETLPENQKSFGSPIRSSSQVNSQKKGQSEWVSSPIVQNSLEKNSQFMVQQNLGNQSMLSQRRGDISIEADSLNQSYHHPFERSLPSSQLNYEIPRDEFLQSYSKDLELYKQMLNTPQQEKAQGKGLNSTNGEVEIGAPSERSSFNAGTFGAMETPFQFKGKEENKKATSIVNKGGVMTFAGQHEKEQKNLIEETGRFSGIAEKDHNSEKEIRKAIKHLKDKNNHQPIEKIELPLMSMEEVNSLMVVDGDEEPYDEESVREFKEEHDKFIEEMKKSLPKPKKAEDFTRIYLDTHKGEDTEKDLLRIVQEAKKSVGITETLTEKVEKKSPFAAIIKDKPQMTKSNVGSSFEGKGYKSPKIIDPFMKSESRTLANSPSNKDLSPKKFTSASGQQQQLPDSQIKENPPSTKREEIGSRDSHWKNDKPFMISTQFENISEVDEVNQADKKNKWLELDKQNPVAEKGNKSRTASQDGSLSPKDPQHQQRGRIASKDLQKNLLEIEGRLSKSPQNDRSQTSEGGKNQERSRPNTGYEASVSDNILRKTNRSQLSNQIVDIPTGNYEDLRYDMFVKGITREEPEQREIKESRSQAIVGRLQKILNEQ